MRIKADRFFLAVGFSLLDSPLLAIVEPRLLRLYLLLRRYVWRDAKSGRLADAYGQGHLVARIGQAKLAMALGTSRTRINADLRALNQLGWLSYVEGGREVHYALGADVDGREIFFVDEQVLAFVDWLDAQKDEPSNEEKRAAMADIIDRVPERDTSPKRTGPTSDTYPERKPTRIENGTSHVSRTEPHTYRDPYTEVENGLKAEKAEVREGENAVAAHPPLLARRGLGTERPPDRTHATTARTHDGPGVDTTATSASTSGRSAPTPSSATPRPAPAPTGLVHHASSGSMTVAEDGRVLIHVDFTKAHSGELRAPTAVAARRAEVPRASS